MGRHSNLILVDDDGRIMESAKQVPPEMSRVRPVLPRLPYAPPPPPDRLDPRSITPAAPRGFSKRYCRMPSLRAHWSMAYHGISPVMARDRVPSHGIERDPRRRCERGGAEPLARETWRCWSRCGQRSGVRRSIGSGVTPIRARSSRALRPTSPRSTTHPVEHVGGTGTGGKRRRSPSPARHAQRQRLLDSVAAARRRRSDGWRRWRRIGAGSAEERLKTAGELIYAYLWQIEPGQTRWTSTAHRSRSIQV